MVSGRTFSNGGEGRRGCVPIRIIFGADEPGDPKLLTPTAPEVQQREGDGASLRWGF